MSFFQTHALRIYRTLTRLSAPAIYGYIRIRQYRGKEDPIRLHERFGRAGVARPEGRLIWLHAASIGEAVSLLTLMDCLRDKQPQTTLLLTTGTVTSSRLLASRLQSGVIHQFTPVDTPQAIARFLDHWQPSLAIFAESELWPNMIMESQKRGVKLALVNARMSERSAASWQLLPEMIARLLSAFHCIAAQSEHDKQRLESLGAKHVELLGNLKHDAPPLSASPKALAALKSSIGARPCVVAASIHPGEEGIIFSAHQLLQKTLPNLLTILVPRHPEKALWMRETAKTAGLRTALRSNSEPLTDTTQIYLADSIGELGLWYRLADVTVIGGSFIPHGGQNPLEAIRLHTPMIVGAHMFNFAEITADLLARQAILQIESPAPESEPCEVILARHLEVLLTHSEDAAAQAERASLWLAGTPKVADSIAEKLLRL